MASRDSFDSMPSSPLNTPKELGNALLVYAKGRRGRTIVASAVLVFIMLVLFVHSSSESLSYESLSNYRLPSWTTKWPGLPFKSTPLLTPSNMTLEIESGNITNVPSHLKKTNPSFHLLMPAHIQNDDFCKSTLSTMLLNYPPPTIITYKEEHKTGQDLEEAKLSKITEYLKDAKHVKDEDLILIVDGFDVWFQLPSDVIIKQYQNVLGDANKRLMEKYGFAKPKGKKGSPRQKFNQTIIFGADKLCRASQEKSPCGSVPESTLPGDIYGPKTGKNTTVNRAKYLNAGTIMGPAGDLRTLFEAAVPRIRDPALFPHTAQSVFSQIFSHQEIAREARRKATQSSTSVWREWISGKLGRIYSKRSLDNDNPTLNARQRYEFSIGLDYTHTLFQPLTHIAVDELVPLMLDNSTDPSPYHHKGTPTPPLTLPPALLEAEAPFITPDPEKNPSPNEKSSFIVPLNIKEDLDTLPDSFTQWSDIDLLTNTFTGAVPVLLHANKPAPGPVNPSKPKQKKHNSSGRRALARGDTLANLIKHPPPPTTTATSASSEPTSAPPGILGPSSGKTPDFTALWFHPFSRALLRRYLRTPQSPIGYHAALVGGDTMWDMRGGRGGVWTLSNSWLGWGEEDGVCGSREAVEAAFGDEKGLWLKEVDKEEERQRMKVLEEMKKKIEEEEEERRKMKMKEEEERKKEEEERKKKEEEMKEQEEEAAAKESKGNETDIMGPSSVEKEPSTSTTEAAPENTDEPLNTEAEETKPRQDGQR